MKHDRCGWDSFIKFVRFEVEDDTKIFFFFFGMISGMEV